MRFLRRKKAWRISSTHSCGPLKAATAAIWLTEQGPLVYCPCSLFIAFAKAKGAAEKPMRQPVMAYAFDTPLITTVRSFMSGKDAMEACAPT